MKSSGTPATAAKPTNLTDQQLLREVMNTVGKADSLGESIRCVVSVSMLTKGWDANNVTHILSVRQPGTQLLCEQVMGRALRWQSYDLNEEELFNVEYGTILGFLRLCSEAGCTRQKPREASGQSCRSLARSSGNRFRASEGCKVELPDEQLSAEFNEDSVLRP
ncbi:MAG: hypothetical protein U0X75_17930 [Acidobacteriota bacterium]